MDGIYKINLVSNDLCVEDTIYQIADSLDNLNGIVDDVFVRITNRIERNLDRTTKLKKRIDISKDKVAKITGMQKAIKVFSSAKYPSSITCKHYESVLDLDTYKYVPHKVNLRNKSQKQTNEKEVQEKLHFYHVKVEQPHLDENVSNVNLRETLHRIGTVGELLIFNTNESPFFESAKKLNASIQTKLNQVESKILEAAPTSIVKRDQVLKREDEYLYTPGMGQVPELEMPLDLPHLPGIAGDVQFSVTTDDAIAPSVVTSPSAPPPEILPGVVAELPDLQLESEEPGALPDIPDAPRAEAAPAAAPPPPPPPPPAPPQPASTVAVEVLNTNKREAAPRAPAAAGAGDAHSSLMAAIRQAGGAGKAKLRPTDSATPIINANGKTGGDLMADLHAKLSMRRRGISGAERAGGTMLHTLAGVIPEPGEQSSPQPSSGDEDWE